MRTESLALHATRSISAFNGLGDQLDEFFGWEGVSWRERFDIGILLWNKRAGGEDSATRQNLGLPARRDATPSGTVCWVAQA